MIIIMILICLESALQHLEKENVGFWPIMAVLLPDSIGYNGDDIHMPRVTHWYSATIWQQKEWLFLPT